MENERKMIHASLWSPIGQKGGFKNDKATFEYVMCNNSENCGLFKRGECSFCNFIGWHYCKYGKFTKEEGYTNKARACSKWVDERKKRSEGVNRLKGASDVMAIVGDYIFLPYAHMTLSDAPFLQKNLYLNKDNCFMLLSDFTVETIEYLINFRPQAMMGGAITSYQKEQVPKFVKHLQEIIPDLYKQLIEKYPSNSVYVDNYNYVGRYAKLETLTPNIGVFTDIHKADWIWDGEYLQSFNGKASFMLVDKYSEIRIKPIPGQKVKITDNLQVNSKTEFLS
jgi:hypothetical protein